MVTVTCQVLGQTTQWGDMANYVIWSFCGTSEQCQACITIKWAIEIQISDDQVGMASQFLFNHFKLCMVSIILMIFI